MRRLPLTRARARALQSLLAIALAILAGGCISITAAARSVPSAASWDSAQQHQALAAGLMQENGGSFDGAGTLSATQANAAMAALAARLQAAASEQTGTPVPGPTGEARRTSTAGPPRAM